MPNLIGGSGEVRHRRRVNNSSGVVINCVQVRRIGGTRQRRVKVRRRRRQLGKRRNNIFRRAIDRCEARTVNRTGPIRSINRQNVRRIGGTRQRRVKVRRRRRQLGKRRNNIFRRAIDRCEARTVNRTGPIRSINRQNVRRIGGTRQRRVEIRRRYVWGVTKLSNCCSHIRCSSSDPGDARSVDNALGRQYLLCGNVSFENRGICRICGPWRSDRSRSTATAASRKRQQQKRQQTAFVLARSLGSPVCHQLRARSRLGWELDFLNADVGN